MDIDANTAKLAILRQVHVRNKLQKFMLTFA